MASSILECPICFEEFRLDRDEYYKNEYCCVPAYHHADRDQFCDISHIFHSRCLEESFSVSACGKKCPLCRSESNVIVIFEREDREKLIGILFRKALNETDFKSLKNDDFAFLNSDPEINYRSLNIDDIYNIADCKNVVNILNFKTFLSTFFSFLASLIFFTSILYFNSLKKKIGLLDGDNELLDAKKKLDEDIQKLTQFNKEVLKHPSKALLERMIEKSNEIKNIKNNISKINKAINASGTFLIISSIFNLLSYASTIATITLKILEKGFYKYFIIVALFFMLLGLLSFLISRITLENIKIKMPIKA